jgi:hypothetical protein
MAPRISDAIKKDHREIESYYEQIVGTSDETEQAKWQNQFTWELARHSIGEELVVYPAFEKYVSGGVELANKDRQEHQSVSRPSLLLLEASFNMILPGKRATEDLPEFEAFGSSVYSYDQGSNGGSVSAYQGRRDE